MAKTGFLSNVSPQDLQKSFLHFRGEHNISGLCSGCTRDHVQFRAEQLLQHFGTQWNQIQQLSESESKEKTNCKDVKFTRRNAWDHGWSAGMHQVRVSSLTSCFYFQWEKCGIEILMHTMSDHLLEGGGGGGEFSTKVQKYKEVLQVLRSHMSTAEPLFLNVFHMRNAGWKKTLFFSIISET